MYLIILLTSLILAAGALEFYLHKRTLSKVPLRILVNGTRGKTSVTRLMAGALRASGLTTYAKCTGTEAMVIGPDGSEAVLARRRGVRLTEQISFFRRAVKGRAQAVVVECMAVMPESQTMMGTYLVRPTLVLLTNARVDHVAEMGPTEEDTLSTLSLSIPDGATVISPESALGRYPLTLIEPDPAPLDPEALTGFDFPVFEDNIRLVFAACDHLGIDRETALAGMRLAKPDVGMAGPFLSGETVVINAFAANDLASTTRVFEDAVSEMSLADYPIHIVFNNRSDREYRLREFAPLFRDLAARGAVLTAVGDNPRKVEQYYHKRTGIPTERTHADALLGPRRVLLCAGNIKGDGKALIERLQAEGRA